MNLKIILYSAFSILGAVSAGLGFINDDWKLCVSGILMGLAFAIARIYEKINERIDEINKNEINSKNDKK